MKQSKPALRIETSIYLPISIPPRQNYLLELTGTKRRIVRAPSILHEYTHIIITGLYRFSSELNV
ncbi:unnamed protein product [Orchesella dallaii]|uniref:Uncharacterized protein n=1 Tax=Orchesella dallaii TaxID=48710 RepID=A0ABP1QX24_9HEXA